VENRDKQCNTMTGELIVVLVILGGAIVLFASDRVRLDIVAIMSPARALVERSPDCRGKLGWLQRLSRHHDRRSFRRR
jgi:hypothetical protein